MFRYHIAAERTEIIVKICDDDVYLPFGINPVKFKGISYHFQNDTFFLRWAGMDFNLPYSKKESITF